MRRGSECRVGRRKYASEKWKSFHPPCTAMKSFHHSSPQQLLQHQFTCFIDTHYLHTMHILFGDMDLWITSTTWWGVTCMCACSLNNMFAGACTFGANQDAFVGPTLMPRSPRASSSSSKSSSWCPLQRFEIKRGIAQYECVLNTHGWQERHLVCFLKLKLIVCDRPRRRNIWAVSQRPLCHPR